jgi:hypothetical protein
MARTTPPTAAPPADAALGPELLDQLVTEHLQTRLPRLRRLWRYYRNPASPTHPSWQAGGDPTEMGSPPLAQEAGLPRRLQRKAADGQRERVIENDIAWRVHTLVDFMAARPPVIRSTADDPGLASRIDALLDAVFDQAGGGRFFHDLVLLGSIYGDVDVLVRPTLGTPLPASLVLLPPTRAIPVIDTRDYRRARGVVIHTASATQRDRGWLSRLRGGGGEPAGWCEAWTASSHTQWHRAGGVGRAGVWRRVGGRVHGLGSLPVVHIQNLPQPLMHPGLSDVEPLIPLQDELNTRLSDRANRVTFQSFKMYLGRGIEGFTDRPVGPGQMWSTSDPTASIQEFGGDAATPGETAHIAEVREAMDKASGVPPIAAGVMHGRVGRLTSENAVRIVLLGLLARVQKKRMTYGVGLQQIAQRVLAAADAAGSLHTTPHQRQVQIDWPDPLPQNETDALQRALLKRQLGVPQDRVLAELGYADCDPAPDPHSP